MTHPQPSPALSADVVAQMPPILHEAVEQMISALSNRRSAWIGDGPQPDMLCHAAAEMFRRLAAENATLRAELAAAEANINAKADWIDATINDMAQGEQDAADLVTVKPLEWHEISRSPARWMGHQAVVTNRDYIIHLTSDSPDVYAWGLDCEGWSGFCDTLQEAKDAAQLDYVRGILSALTTTADKE